MDPLGVSFISLAKLFKHPVALLSAVVGWTWRRVYGRNAQSTALKLSLRYERRFCDDDPVVFQQTDYQRVFTGRKNKILNTSTGVRWDLPLVT